MTDFRMNLRMRGKVINNKVIKPNRIIINENNRPNNDFVNIKSIHEKILEENIIKKAGYRGVGLAMSYACAGKALYNKKCGCGGS